MIKRYEVHNLSGLKCGEVEDCLLSSCCAYRVLVQMEREVSNCQSSWRPVKMIQQQQQGGWMPQQEGMEVVTATA